jgi:glycosyltransferase involved in cell wall biosynthesis
VSNHRPTRILFLARRYPPSIGGIETHCHELYTRLVKQADVRLVALGHRSLFHLAWFLPYCLWTTFWAVLLRRSDVIYFADGVAGFIAPFVRPFGPARFVITIYGLEMTYKNPIARTLMQAGARACEKVVVISQNTYRITADVGIDESTLETIYLGVEPPTLPEQQLVSVRQRFEAQHGVRFGEDRVLFMFGRQVRRKGMADFIEQGMPLLDDDVKLIIGGQGPEAERIADARDRLGLEERIIVLGRIPDDELTMLRYACDLFIMPNIRVPNDVEGFGQTQLECMHAGMPVVAFAVDALTESVREGGYLIEPDDYAAFTAQVHAYYALDEAEREGVRQSCRAYVRANYTWDAAAHQYMNVFEGRAPHAR